MRTGCLFGLLVVAAVAYWGADIGSKQIRYVRMRDSMKEQARFATNLDDAVIRRRLRATAESLNLPVEAQRITIRRRSRPREVVISTSWQDTLSLPFYQYILPRSPEVRERL
ncbi:MAG TPA: hypothetical protein VGA37_14900 [Gemmatimonadales bacterium]